MRLLIARGVSLLQRSRPRRERWHAALLIELKLEPNLNQRMLLFDAHWPGSFAGQSDSLGLWRVPPKTDVNPRVLPGSVPRSS